MFLIIHGGNKLKLHILKVSLVYRKTLNAIHSIANEQRSQLGVIFSPINKVVAKFLSDLNGKLKPMNLKA